MGEDFQHVVESKSHLQCTEWIYTKLSGLATIQRIAMVQRNGDIYASLECKFFHSFGEQFNNIW